MKTRIPVRAAPYGGELHDQQGEQHQGRTENAQGMVVQHQGGSQRGSSNERHPYAGEQADLGVRLCCPGGLGNISFGSAGKQAGDHAGEISRMDGDAACSPPGAILQAQGESHADDKKSKPDGQRRSQGEIGQADQDDLQGQYRKQQRSGGLPGEQTFQDGAQHNAREKQADGQDKPEKNQLILRGYTDRSQDKIPGDMSRKGLGQDERRGIAIAADKGQSEGKPGNIATIFSHQGNSPQSSNPC